MQKYFFANGSEQRGPYSLEELASCGLRPDTLVWHEGLTVWQRADAVPELAATIRTAHPAEATGPATMYPSFPAGQAQLDYQTRQPLPTDGMAIASLVLGLVSFPMLCIYLAGIVQAVLAIVFGFIARSRINRGERTGAGLALAGLICGFISVGLILVLFIVAFIIGMIAAMK